MWKRSESRASQVCNTAKSLAVDEVSGGALLRGSTGSIDTPAAAPASGLLNLISSLTCAPTGMIAGPLAKSKLVGIAAAPTYAGGVTLAVTDLIARRGTTEISVGAQ